GALRFLFQAEDGIRDPSVTGVQTCALPISLRASHHIVELDHERGLAGTGVVSERLCPLHQYFLRVCPEDPHRLLHELGERHGPRSEERRVGKEWSKRRARKRWKGVTRQRRL